MTVKLLIITHDEVGQALIKATTQALGELPLPIQLIKVAPDTVPEQLITQLQQLCSTLSPDDGLLVLTDLYGSTPANIAVKLQNCQQIQVIAGLNLPMLIRVMNYPCLGLKELVQKAVSGGKDGVMLCSGRGYA